MPGGVPGLMPAIAVNVPSCDGIVAANSGMPALTA
jgi:hypothetical protein